ncbi:MAG: hypothetical protein QXR19_08710 [Candidatus Jordarchaeaceae archaeon]
MVKTKEFVEGEGSSASIKIVNFVEGHRSWRLGKFVLGLGVYWRSL